MNRNVPAAVCLMEVPCLNDGVVDEEEDGKNNQDIHDIDEYEIGYCAPNASGR